MDALEEHGAEDGEAFVRLVYAEILDAAGDPKGAREAIGLARDRLAERAVKISSPAAREAFLTRVPEHALIMELARAWCGGG
jgi:hypothetical protein